MLTIRLNYINTIHDVKIKNPLLVVIIINAKRVHRTGYGSWKKNQCHRKIHRLHVVDVYEIENENILWVLFKNEPL